MPLSQNEILEKAFVAFSRSEELHREQRAVDAQLETFAMALGIHPRGLLSRRRQLEERVQKWRENQAQAPAMLPADPSPAGVS